MDVSIADFIIPRLQKFKKHGLNESLPIKEIKKNGKLVEFSKKEFSTIIDKIITAFTIIKCDMDYYRKYPGYSPDMSQKSFNDMVEDCNKKIEEGMTLFAKYIQSLWY